MDNNAGRPTPKLDSSTASTEVGYASSINDYIVWINGLPNVKINEIVTTKAGSRAIVTAISNNQVEALMLDDVAVAPEEMFRRSGSVFSIEVGQHLLGRSISPLGVPIDGKGRFTSPGISSMIEKPVLGIKAREKITRQFETGITLVDMLVPVSYGQRELLIGDARSGKTSLLIDIIINQRSKNLICIYAMIGKPIVEIKRLAEVLTINKAKSYCVIVAASSSERAPLIFLTPGVAVAIAEYFQSQGQDVLLILDDMGLHAKYYREISLLSGTAPGRESYPGDIFYQQAKLIERAGNFNKNYHGGSITALPVIETNLDDFSGFMPTNLMAMTDGHLLFSSARYHQGHRPSIDVAKSVSRVGRQTQLLAQKELADRVKTVLAEAAKLEAFSRLGTEVSAVTLAKIKHGKQIEAILSQPPLTKIPFVVQMIVLGLTFTPLFSQRDVEFVTVNIGRIINYLQSFFDLSSFSKKVAGFKNDQEFLNSLNGLIPDIAKICQVDKKPRGLS